MIIEQLMNKTMVFLGAFVALRDQVCF